MGHEELVVASKTLALLLFLPLFVGACVHAYWPGRALRLQAQALIPLRDDDDEQQRT